MKSEAECLKNRLQLVEAHRRVEAPEVEGDRLHEGAGLSLLQPAAGVAFLLSSHLRGTAIIKKRWFFR